MLYCHKCGAEYSANKGDYFMLADNHVFKCECGARLALVEKRTQYVAV